MHSNFYCDSDDFDVFANYVKGLAVINSGRIHIALPETKIITFYTAMYYSHTIIK